MVSKQDWAHRYGLKTRRHPITTADRYALLRGRAEPRYAADILTILVFVMLGLALRRRDLLVGLIALQAVVCIVAFWELASAQSFAATFMVKDFYVNTRGFLGDAVWSGPENLFISSERPRGRLFGAALDLHHASSVFLEPVSLGNWTVIVTLAIAALRPARRVIIDLVVTNLFLLFACDGRLALAVNLMLLVTWPILPRLPIWSAWLWRHGSTCSGRWTTPWEDGLRIASTILVVLGRVTCSASMTRAVS